jgi:RNA polymerase sigma factor (sigma-70 family)
MPSPPDKDSFQSVLRGDPKAVTAWIEKNRGRLIGFARHDGASPEDASEVVQETLLALWHMALAGFEGFRGKTEAELFKWLSTAIHHEIIDRKRKHQPRLTLDKPLGEDGETAGAQVADNASTGSQRLMRDEELARHKREYERLLAEFEAALAGAPEGAREAFSLRHFEGWDVESIARHQGVKYGVAGTRIFKAKEAIVQRLGENGWERLKELARSLLAEQSVSQILRGLKPGAEAAPGV